MTNIVKFPKEHRSRPAPAEALTQQPLKVEAKQVKSRGFLSALSKGAWVLTAICWPVLKWVLSLDCVFQLVRMIYHWDTPGIYAGWNFLLHFSVLCAATYYVSLHKPKGL
jgi:hypothetical protein